MLALCFMLSSPYYAENYAGIIDSSLPMLFAYWFSISTHLLHAANLMKYNTMYVIYHLAVCIQTLPFSCMGTYTKSD